MEERDDLVLIKNYEENPSDENAEQVARYWWKHGWWPLILSNKNNELIAKAYNQYQDKLQQKEKE